MSLPLKTFTRFLEEMSYMFSFTFFHWRSFSPCIGGRSHFSCCHRRYAICLADSVTPKRCLPSPRLAKRAWFRRNLDRHFLEYFRDFLPKKPRVAFGLPYLFIELFYIGTPVVRMDGRCTVTWLPNFLEWVDLLTHDATLARASHARAPLLIEWKCDHLNV